MTVSSQSTAPSATAPGRDSSKGALIVLTAPLTDFQIIAGKFLGVMARLRDLLPGSYSFGITGRGPTSTRLPPGAYEVRLAAWPTLPLDAKPDRLQVSFQLD